MHPLKGCRADKNSQHETSEYWVEVVCSTEVSFAIARSSEVLQTTEQRDEGQVESRQVEATQGCLCQYVGDIDLLVVCHLYL